MTNPTLPRQAYLNAKTLQESLDHLLNDHIYHHVQIARDIAHTIKTLQVDYATQLSLIQTALSHRYFKPAGYLKHYLSMVAVRAQLAMNYVFNLSESHFIDATTEAERILLAAREDIRKSKSKLILS